MLKDAIVGDPADETIGVTTAQVSAARKAVHGSYRSAEGSCLPWEDPNIVHQTAVPFAGVDLRSPEERAYVEQLATEPELERLRRRCSEYFTVIEQIEKQRDGWLDMYQMHVREHTCGQITLEKKIVELRQLAARVIHHVQDLRKRLGMDELSLRGLDDLEPYDGEPVGTAERYTKRMIELTEAMPELINGAIRREQITLATQASDTPEPAGDHEV